MMPHARDWDENATFPVETLRKAAALGFGGIYVQGRRRRLGADAARRHDHLRGAGAGLHLDRRLYLDPQHGGLDDRRVRRRRAAATLPAEALHHGAFRELLPDRAGLRLRCREPEDARDARRRPLRAQRHQGLHLGRRRLRRLCLHGAHRRGRAARHLVHRGREGHAGALLRRAGEEARLEIAADRDGDVRELPRAGREPDRRRRAGLQDRDGGARRRAAQHRGLLDRRRAVLPRPHHRIHARAQAVRHAARRFPGAARSASPTMRPSCRRRG